MGQYYRAYIDSEGRKVARKFCPHDAVWGAYVKQEKEAGRKVPKPNGEEYYEMWNGLKLMEHSWMGNLFVSGVLEAIEDAPARVAWVGDYADHEGDVYEFCWGCDEAGKRKHRDTPFEAVPEPILDGWIVNTTKKVALDLADYYEVCRYRPDWAGDGPKDWCIHPLPLLCAIGNGRGGGDYRGANDHLCGSWAMDTIYWTRGGLPEGFEVCHPLQYRFKE